MDNEQIKRLVRKYIKGDCSAEERRALLAWWEECLEKGDPADVLSPAEEEALKSAMFVSIQDAIRRKHDLVPQRTPPAKIPHWRSYKVYLAAASVVLAALCVAYYHKMQTDLTVITTAYGETREIVLPDQSVIMLNGNSTVRYASSWDDRADRDVWLDGEAYFEVVHTVRHTPFTVHASDDLTIRVLGTKFNVNNNRGVTEVVLDEGKVKLQHAGETYVMKPNEVVRYARNDGAFESRMNEAQEKASWKNNVLIFEDEALSAIASRLEDRYGLKVVFEKENLGNERFTGSIPTDSVAVFIDKVKKLYSVEVSLEDDVYVVR